MSQWDIWLDGEVKMSKQEKIVCAAVRVWAGDDENIELFVNYPAKYLTGNAQIGYAGYQKGFITNKNRFADPVEAMKIAVEADQVGGILWKKVEARMLNDCGFIDRSKVKGKAIDETIKSYLEFPLKPEDLY